MISLRFQSQLSAPPQQVWAQVSTMAGVNAELSPLMRMTHPADRADLKTLPIQPGVPVFQSWLLMLSCLPMDRHALTFDRILPGVGFDERSTSWMQQVWVHRRRVLPAAGGCVVTDELEIQPRLGLFAPMLRLIVTALFQHRHRYLRRQFGALQG